MKKKTYIMLIAIVAALSVACSADENAVPAAGTEVTTTMAEETTTKSTGEVVIMVGGENDGEMVTSVSETVPKAQEVEPPETSAETTAAKTTADETTSAEADDDVREVTYIDGILIANKTYALPKDYNPGVDSKAKRAFDEMQAAAGREGLNIYISSGFRSYEYQAGLYNRYVSNHGKAEADRFSARPGHSEHQTGLAFDLNTIDDSFAGTAEGKWVAEHCHEYGFIIRYPEGKEHITGYLYEPWHIRYLGVENATKVYESGKTLEEYLGITSEYAE